MATLYELTDEYLVLLDSISEDGEIPPDIELRLNQKERDIEKKVEGSAKVIKNKLSEIDELREEEKRLADRRRSLEGDVNWLKDYVVRELRKVHQRKVKTSLFTVWRQESVSYQYDGSLEQLEKLRPDLVNVKKSFAASIAKDLEKEGVNISALGVKKETKEFLQIR